MGGGFIRPGRRGRRGGRGAGRTQLIKKETAKNVSINFVVSIDGICGTSTSVLVAAAAAATFYFTTGTYRNKPEAKPAALARKSFCTTHRSLLCGDRNRMCFFILLFDFFRKHREETGCVIGRLLVGSRSVPLHPLGSLKEVLGGCFSSGVVYCKGRIFRVGTATHTTSSSDMYMKAGEGLQFAKRTSRSHETPRSPRKE